MAKATIAGTDTVNAALETKCNANFTELYNYLTGTTAPTLLTPTIASFANATHTHANAAGGGATIAPTTITVSDWTDVSSFGTGWSAGSGTTVSYMKDPMGFVHLRGLCTGSPGGANVAFTLPSGYRPAITFLFGPSATSPPWQIQTDGDVYSSTVTDSIILDGITFKAA